MASKGGREKIKLESTAGTGHRQMQRSEFGKRGPGAVQHLVDLVGCDKLLCEGDVRQHVATQHQADRFLLWKRRAQLDRAFRDRWRRQDGNVDREQHDRATTGSAAR